MENCIFCRIASKEIPAQVVHEDEATIAFLDTNPKAPGHTLIIPKAHYQWFYEVPDDLTAKLFVAAKKIAIELKDKVPGGYVQLSIVGKDVPHTHIHLVPHAGMEYASAL